MPWSVHESPSGCSPSKPWAVRNDATGATEGCHATKAEAEAHQRALYANVGDASVRQFAAGQPDLGNLVVSGDDPVEGPTDYYERGSVFYPIDGSDPVITEGAPPPTDGFLTHSHGKRKNKGRQPGKADITEPRGGGGGGGGGPGTGRVDRSQIHEASGGAYSVSHGGTDIGVTVDPDVKLSADQAADYMDGIAAGIDVAPLKSGRPIQVHVTATPPSTMTPSTRSWVHPTEVSRTGSTEAISIGIVHTPAAGGRGIHPAGVPDSTVAAAAGYGRVQSYASGFAFTGPPGRAPRGAEAISAYAATNNATFHSEAFVAHVYGASSAANPGKASAIVSDIAKTEGWGPSPAALTASSGGQFAAGEDAPTSAIVAFLPADPESLVVDGGDPADQLHITCVYLTEDASQLDDAARSAIDEALAEIATVGPPITCDVSGVCTFRPGSDGTSATGLVLESHDLSFAHDMVEDIMEPYVAPDHEDFPQWIPHLTLGYSLPPGTGMDRLGQQIVVDRLALFIAGAITEYPLTGGGPGADVNPVPDQTAPPPTPPAAPPAAAATVPAFRIIGGGLTAEEAASDTPAMAITRHPAAGFYAGPAPLHAVKEN